MSMKSKCYALVLCTSLLCVGSAWGVGCPKLNEEHAGTMIGEKGTPVVGEWTVTETEAVGVGVPGSRFIPAEDGTSKTEVVEGVKKEACLYKDDEQRLLKLSKPSI